MLLTPAPLASLQELLAKARANLKRVGAVVMADRMRESLAYLAHVLGVRAPFMPPHVNANPHTSPTDEHTQQALLAATQLDRALYEGDVQAAFSAQLEALRTFGKL